MFQRRFFLLSSCLFLLSSLASQSIATHPFHILSEISTTSEKSSHITHLLHKHHRRDEENQPNIAPYFPNLLGPSRLLKWMHQKADPCNNFFEYACGGFDDLYKNRQTADVLSLMQESNTLLMEQLLNKKESELAETQIEHEIVGKLQTYYRSCLNADLIEQRDFEPIIPLAQMIVKETSKPGATLPKVLALLNLNAVYPFVRTLYTKIEGKSFSDVELEVYPAYGFNVDSKTVWAVLKLFEEAGVLHFQNQEALNAIVAWICEMEEQQVLLTQNANYVMAERNYIEGQTISITALNNKTQLDWNDYLDTMNLTGITKVHLWGEAKQFQTALYNIGQIQLSHLKYYFIWRLAAAHFNKLSDPYFTLWTTKIWTTVEKSYYEDGEIRNQVFQTDCVTEIGMHLNFLSGYLFVNYAFNDTQRESAKQLVTDLMSAARRSINDLNWMDEQTKSSAIKKIDTMEQIVGYPDWLSGDGSKIVEYYKTLDFVESEYFENAVGAQAFGDIYPSIYELQREKEQEQNGYANATLNRDSVFYGYPWQLNAFHLTDLNQMQINPGILQRPLFSALNPTVMNYGSLGSIIGHEITHAFDSLGRRINYNGELAPWWSEAANNSFNVGAQCFVDQYDRMSVTLHSGKKLYVDGKLTLPENIADNGGMDLALEAWRKYMAREKGQAEYDSRWGSESVPGFHGLTVDQVFFVSFAQTWCQVQKDFEVEYLIKNDVHSPNPVRVRGVLQNAAEFQRAFNCKVGDKYVADGGDPNRCYLY